MNNSRKVVLITGCSSGFGLLSSVYLARRGYRVVATMRNLEKRADFDEECAKYRLKIPLYRLDVTDSATIRDCLADIKATYGRLDVLVNNAGYGIGGFFEDLTDEEFRAQMETNFFGVLNMIRESLPLLRAGAAARIINISSVAGLTATPGMGAYNASKWALEGFSESLRQELTLSGIGVFLIEPGPYPTKALGDNTRFAQKFGDKNSPNYAYSRKVYRKYRQRIQSINSDAMDIPRLIEKLISAPNPPFRSVIGPTARLRYYFRRFLPYRLVEWITRRVIFGK